jgi:hypothetical protein
MCSVCVYMKEYVNIIRSSLWILLLLLLFYYHQDNYNYIPETNHFFRVNSVAAVLYLQFLLHVMLFRMCTFTLVLSEACVQCLIWLFYSSFIIIIIIIIIISSSSSSSSSSILRCIVHEIPRGHLSD